MDFTLIGILGLAALLILLFLGLHMGVDFILVGLVGLTILINFEAAMSLLGETLYNAIATPTFCVLPLFILMGAFASRGGFAELAYANVHKICARLPGALAIATSFGCAIFASICGSTIATATIFGRLAYPEMQRYKYEKSYALGAIACSGSFACMIPPSGMFILFAIFTEQSVGKLFLAGILPGILTAFVYASCMFIRAKMYPHLAPIHPEEFKVTPKDRAKATIGLWPIVLLASLVIGGIYTGIFTANEAGAVGAFGALLFGIAYGRLRKIQPIRDSLAETASTTAMLFFIIIAAMYFSRFLTMTRIPTDLASFLANWQVHPHIVFICIIAVWFFLGMVIYQAAVFALTLPIIFPVLVGLGYEPIWICVVAMKLNEIAGITPPVGINAFALAGVTKSRVEDIFKGVLPFILCDVVVIIMLFLWPEIALYLPNHMF